MNDAPVNRAAQILAMRRRSSRACCSSTPTGGCWSPTSADAGHHVSAPQAMPETLSFDIFSEIGRIGGVALSLLRAELAGDHDAVDTARRCGHGTRRLCADSPAKGAGFAVIRYGFLVTIMYPYMLLVIPVYLVMFRLGLLGSYAGIILFLALGPAAVLPVRAILPQDSAEVIEAAIIDGASEWQVLTRVVLPMAAPITATVLLVTFTAELVAVVPDHGGSRVRRTPTRCCGAALDEQRTRFELPGHHGACRDHEAARGPAVPDRAEARHGGHGGGAVKG